MAFRSNFELLALTTVVAVSLLSYGNAQVVPQVRSLTEYGSAYERLSSGARPIKYMEVSLSVWEAKYIHCEGSVFRTNNHKWNVPLQTTLALEVLEAEISPGGTTFYGTPRSFGATVVNIGISSSANLGGNITFLAAGVPICTAPLIANNSLVGTQVRNASLILLHTPNHSLFT